MKRKVHYDPQAGKEYLHPGRQANIVYEGQVVGYLGEIHPDVADNYKIGEKDLCGRAGYAERSKVHHL